MKIRTRLQTGVFAALLALAPLSQAMERAFGWSRILSTGAPAPTATVTVRNAGTATLSSVFSDNLSTPKANPFTADSSGYWFFYAANGRYDITFSGGGIVTPYTLSDFVILDSTAVGSICGVSGSGISFLVGSTGTDFNLNCNDGTDTITYNIPSASGTNRGLVTTGAQVFAGAKTFSTPIGAASGGTGVNAGAATNGQLLIGNGSGFSLATLTQGANNGVTIANGPGTITLSTVQNIQTTASPTFDSLTLTGGTPMTWTSFNTGGVAVDAAGVVQSIDQGNGEILIGVTGNLPQSAALGAGPGVSVTSGAGAITINNTYSLGGLAASSFPTQTFAIAATGSDFGISSVSGVHTFSLPSADVAARGVVTVDDQTFGGRKTFNDNIYSASVGAGAPQTGTDVPAAGLSLIPQRGTGSGVCGGVDIYISERGASGTAPHNTRLFERMGACSSVTPYTTERGILDSFAGEWIHGFSSELLTLSTVGATTNTSANLLPADAIIEAVTTRVTTTISGGGVANFSVGDSTTAARFSASTTGLTAGSTRVGIAHWSGAVSTLATGPSQAAAASVRITCDATPTAGVIRITVFYRRFVAPTS